jgi:hypothetical protein
MTAPVARSDATGPVPAFLQLHKALADLAMASRDFIERSRTPLWQYRLDTAWRVLSEQVAYFAMSSHDTTGGGSVPTLVAVRVENPNPEREVDNLVLEAVDRSWSTHLLLAVTLNAAPVPGEYAP